MEPEEEQNFDNFFDYFQINEQRKIHSPVETGLH